MLQWLIREDSRGKGYVQWEKEVAEAEREEERKETVRGEIDKREKGERGDIETGAR